MTQPQRRVMQLSDSRQLSYVLAGVSLAPPSTKAQQPDGATTRAVLYHHGWPSSGMELKAWHDKAIDGGVTLIGVDRPGVSYSTLNAQGSFESYADDVAQLLRHLGLTSVIHIGVSGGGPYACACAALQTHTTAALGLVASMTHCAGPGSFELVQGMDWFNRLGFAFVAYAPGLTQLGLTVAAPFVAAAADAVSELCADISRGSRRGDAGDSCGGGSSSSVMWKAAAFVGGAALLPAPDRHAVLSRPCLCIQALSAAVADAFRQGSRGFFADMRLTASGPWSFDLSSISAPTVVFQGTSDVNVTLPMARWLSHQIPGAELREVVGEAHFSLVLNHAAEVLRVLQDKAVAVAAGGGGSKQEESPSQRLRNGLLAAWQALQCG